jgi:hypothetical protein
LGLISFDFNFPIVINSPSITNIYQ